MAGSTRVAGAQAVSAIDDDALTLPGGVVRLSGAFIDTRYNSRYGTGGLQPLGSDLSLDSLGPAELPILAPLQSSLRALTLDPTLGVSLGSVQTTSSVLVQTAPIGLDIGITHRLTLHALVPIVHTHNEILFNPNPGGSTGNVGFNPALYIAASRAIDTMLYGQFAHAAANLQSALAACAANPASASYCPSLNAQRSTASALVAQSNSFASSLSQVYGGDGRAPAPVVPIGSSAALAAINQRMQSFAARYAHFDSLTGGPGIASQGPVGAPPLGLGDAQALLTTNAIGLAYDSLQSVDQYGIGDIQLGATALLLDSFHGSDSARVHPHGFNYRLALTGTFQLGTGTPNSPDALVGVGTGTGANAVGLHAQTDLLFGSHFWASLVFGGTQPLTDQVSARIPLGLGDVFAPLFTRQTVTRSLGRVLDFTFNPQLTINSYVGIVAQYRYVNRSADKYSGTFTLDSAATGFGPVALNADLLGAGTASTQQLVGLGITFSTVAAATRHASRLPFDITYFHFQTLTGSAGAYGSLPRIGSDEVLMRVYVRLLGHGGAFKR